MSIWPYETQKIKLDRIISDLVTVKYELKKAGLTKEEMDELRHRLLDVHELARSTTEILNKKEPVVEREIDDIDFYKKLIQNATKIEAPKIGTTESVHAYFIQPLQSPVLHNSTQDPSNS